VHIAGRNISAHSRVASHNLAIYARSTRYLGASGVGEITVRVSQTTLPDPNRQIGTVILAGWAQGHPPPDHRYGDTPDTDELQEVAELPDDSPDEGGGYDGSGTRP
jgi:hypothetical protein